MSIVCCIPVLMATQLFRWYVMLKNLNVSGPNHNTWYKSWIEVGIVYIYICCNGACVFHQVINIQELHHFGYSPTLAAMSGFNWNSIQSCVKPNSLADPLTSCNGRYPDSAVSIPVVGENLEGQMSGGTWCWGLTDKDFSWGVAVILLQYTQKH